MAIFSVPDHPIVRYLWPLDVRNSDPTARVDAVASAYEESTGVPVGRPLTVDDRAHIRDWLIAQEAAQPTNSDGHFVSLLAGTGFQTFLPPVHEDLARKTGWLQQAPCLTCLPADLNPARVALPIRTKPFTSQVGTPEARTRFQRIKVLIRERLARSRLDLASWVGHELCVNVVAVVPQVAKRKDVDNMVKGLLDAMTGPIYQDDRLVQHLSSRRVVHDGDADDAYYLVRLMPVTDARDDVVDTRLRHGWLGQPEIVAD